MNKFYEFSRALTSVNEHDEPVAVTTWCTLQTYGVVEHAHAPVLNVTAVGAASVATHASGFQYDALRAHLVTAQAVQHRLVETPYKDTRQTTTFIEARCQNRFCHLFCIKIARVSIKL